MKYIITLLFLSFFLVSCQSRLKCIKHGALGSKTEDIRCLKIQEEGYKKGIETGVCYNGPVKNLNFEKPGVDPDPEACNAIHEEVKKKCDALPFDPKYTKVVSGSSFCN